MTWCPDVRTSSTFGTCRRRQARRRWSLLPNQKSTWYCRTTTRRGCTPTPGFSQRVREALGFRVLSLEHIGSTAVPGLPAKPIIDVDLVVADPDCEEAYLPALESTGFVLRLREPWWYRHRMLRLSEPRTNLHVFGYDSPEPLRHRIFRDWLRVNAEDRALYASAKLEAVRAATSLGEDVMRYNERKSKVLRAIYGRAFVAAGLLDAYP